MTCRFDLVQVSNSRIFCILLSLALILPTNKSLAQNLVPNPGFEEFLSCPGYYARSVSEFKAMDWTSAGLGTPDHFHGCSNGEADVPYNWAGVSEAYEGNGYAGIYLWIEGNRYREYLQCKLAEPLVKDSVYYVEFHYRLSSYSLYSIDRVGLLFSETLVHENHDKVITRSPDMVLKEDSALTLQTGLWQEARQQYKARGGERYIVIGNFSETDSTRHYHIQFRSVQEEMLRNAAYYYVDNVSVQPRFNPVQQAIDSVLPTFDPTDVVVNRTYVLPRINFQFNSSKLSYASTETLDKLVTWLTAHANTVISLAGHTDDVGGDRYNLQLSKSRAQSVAHYLISNGIATNRITHTGFGKNRPLVNGTSETERALNRRVEVRFLQ